MEFGVRTESENISEQIYVYVFQMTCDQTVYTSARRTSGKHPTRGKIDSGKLYRWKHYVRKGSLKTRQRPILLGATRASAAPLWVDGFLDQVLLTENQSVMLLATFLKTFENERFEETQLANLYTILYIQMRCRCCCRNNRYAVPTVAFGLSRNQFRGAAASRSCR